MNYKYSNLFKWISIIIDYSLLNTVLYIAFAITSKSVSTGLSSIFEICLLILNLVWFFSSTVVELYKNVLKREAELTFKASLSALLLFTLLSFALKAFLPQIHLSDRFIIYYSAMFGFVLCISKTAFLLLRKSRRAFWIKYNKIIIIGAGHVGIDLYKYIISSPEMGYKIEGIFDDDYNKIAKSEYPVLGKIDECFEFAKKNGVSEIYCALPNQYSQRIKELLEEADKQMVRIKLVPDIKGAFNSKVMFDIYGQLPILAPRLEPLENKTNETIKRLFDIGFSLFVIIFLLSWLAPLIGILIKLESKGPVFFKQLRSGKDNKPFYCLKFRSMKVNADSDLKQASKGDSRVTKIGAFLRKSSLDELPQFFNVLMGDMSVVGPRPHMIKQTEDYSLLIDKYMVRHFLTPGITGWAQVNGFRGETKETISMSKRVDADLWYLENWSFFLDLKIVFLTIWKSFKENENAY